MIEVVRNATTVYQIQRGAGRLAALQVHTFPHRLNMEVDLQSLFGLLVT
jgi:hypothetical protein